MKSLLYFQTFQHSENPNADWVLFIHGAGGSTATWKKQLEQYKKHFNLLLIDLPGHAQSAKSCLDIHKYSFEFIAQKCWEVVDHLNIDKVHAVAVSLGSIISIQMLDQQPSRISSLVFSGPITSLDMKLRIFLKSGLILAKFIGFRNFYKMMAKIILPKKNHASARKVFIREANALTDEEYRKWTALYGKELDSKLKSLFGKKQEVPIFILVGTEDHFFLSSTKRYVRRFPSVQMEIIEKCGHLVSLEKPGTFNQKSIAFIQENIDKPISLVRNE